VSETNASGEIFAGFWSRVGASFIDTVLLALIIGPVLWAVYGAAYLDSDSLIQGPVDFLLSYVFPAIAVIVFWIYKSSTPGKMAFGMRIVDARTGETPTTAQFVGRYLGYYVSTLPLLLGFLWVAWDPKKQGFHDKLAGTVVVRRKRATEVPSFPA
jgi:uncharacterized RDD family membrane protein YckC